MSFPLLGVNDNPFPREEFQRIADRIGRNVYCWLAEAEDGSRAWVYQTHPKMDVLCRIVGPSAARYRVGLWDEFPPSEHTHA